MNCERREARGCDRECGVQGALRARFAPEQPRTRPVAARQ